MTKHRYLHRRAARRAQEALKQQAVFGIVLGMAGMLYGLLGYLAGIALPDFLYLAIFAAGLTLLGIGLACPRVIRRPSELFRHAMNGVGHGVFTVLLTCIYYVLVVPLGFFRRRSKPWSPFVRWENSMPKSAAWSPKITQTIFHERAGAANLVGSACNVVLYFARHGNWLLIPLLVILLSLGLILFFVQTSALAPFIYTLF